MERTLSTFKPIIRVNCNCVKPLNKSNDHVHARIGISAIKKYNVRHESTPFQMLQMGIGEQFEKSWLSHVDNR